MQRAQQSQGVTIGCAGVQLDDWKLVAAFSDVGGGGGGGAISVHDIRAAGRPLRGCAWQEPVLTLRTRARINCFQVGMASGCVCSLLLPALGGGCYGGSWRWVWIAGTGPSTPTSLLTGADMERHGWLVLGTHF